MKAITLIIAALLAIVLWSIFSNSESTQSEDDLSTPNANLETASDSQVHEINSIGRETNSSNNEDGVSEEVLARIRNEFAEIFPTLYTEYEAGFLVLEEQRLQATIDSESSLPLDKFFSGNGHLLGKVPLSSSEEFESLTIFQMEHCNNLLNAQNREFIRFSDIPTEHWQSFSMEKVGSAPFRYPPDVLYSYLSGETPASPNLISKLGDIRANALLALADVFQRRMLLNRTANNYLEVECGVDYHAPGFDEAVKLALDQVGMAQSLQDEEDMIMHRYLNQIRYEAQLANPDIVVR